MYNYNIDIPKSLYFCESRYIQKGWMGKCFKQLLDFDWILQPNHWSQRILKGVKQNIWISSFYWCLMVYCRSRGFAATAHWSPAIFQKISIFSEHSLHNTMLQDFYNYILSYTSNSVVHLPSIEMKGGRQRETLGWFTVQCEALPSITHHINYGNKCIAKF